MHFGVIVSWNSHVNSSVIEDKCVSQKLKIRCSAYKYLCLRRILPRLKILGVLPTIASNNILTKYSLL
jgi:hypothetical protein